MIKSIAAVFLGGGLGACSRLLLSRAFFQWSLTEKHAWLPIMLINVIGSFIIGVCYILLTKHFAVSLFWRNFILVGILGGFTTFSSFSLNVMVALEFGNMTGAIANVVLSVVLSLLACASGISLAKVLVSM